ncbi:MAG: RIP metalloprotease RseP [Pseudomonadota bacterium]
MSVVLNNIFSLIITISVLVAIHEFGHYIVARMCGIKVLRFSIGFGKPIISRRWGADQTEYCISALPLGGYVKMLDEREGNVSPQDANRSFNAQPVWQRIAVLLAGPAFNFLFAIAAYWFIFSVGMQVTRPVVGQVVPDSPAARAGLQYNDVIAAIGDRTIKNWQGGVQVLVNELVDDARIPLTIERADGSRLDVVIEASKQAARLSEPGKLFESLGFRPWSERAIVGEATPGSAAELANMRSGDQVIAVNGEPVFLWTEFVTAVRANGDAPLALQIVRDGVEQTIDMSPRMVEEQGQRIPRVGVTAQDQRPDNLYGVEQYGWAASLPVAVNKTAETIGFTFKIFGRMLTGSVSTKNISGPINIAQYATVTLSRGGRSFLDFLAMVSVSLGVLNLLPIPMLDGGQIVYQAVEGLTGKPLSEKWQIAGQQVGIFLLLGVMSLAFYNDIARVVGQLLS